jgi:hypothetical protein
MDYRLSKHGDALTALADIGGGVSKSAQKKSPKTIFTITFSRFRFGKFNRKGVLFRGLTMVSDLGLHFQCVVNMPNWGRWEPKPTYSRDSTAFERLESRGL